MQVPHGDHGHLPISDLNAREVAALAPLLTLCLVLGLYPQPMLDLIRPDVEAVAKLYGEIKAVQPKLVSTESQMTTPGMAPGAEALP